jgi:hypothetical protein
VLLTSPKVDRKRSAAREPSEPSTATRMRSTGRSRPPDYRDWTWRVPSDGQRRAPDEKSLEASEPAGSNHNHVHPRLLRHMDDLRINRVTLARVEAGANVSLELLSRIARALDVTLVDLMR